MLGQRPTRAAPPPPSPPPPVRPQALAQATGSKDSAIKAKYDDTGDLGLVAVNCRGHQKTLFTPPPLTLRGVRGGWGVGRVGGGGEGCGARAGRRRPSLRPLFPQTPRAAACVVLPSPMNAPLLPSLPLLPSCPPTGIQRLPGHCVRTGREERGAQERADRQAAGGRQGPGGRLRHARAAGPPAPAASAVVAAGRRVAGAGKYGQCSLFPTSPARPRLTAGQAAHRAGGADGAGGAGARGGAAARGGCRRRQAVQRAPGWAAGGGGSDCEAGGGEGGERGTSLFASAGCSNVGRGPRCAA